MAKSAHVNIQTSIKRVSGTNDLVGVRMHPARMKELDDWRRKQDDMPGRPEAIRRLVELGLKAEKPSKPAYKAGRRSRAAELAASAIETLMIDPSATSEERAQRRRRLTKGPTEFREHRVDLPRVKK
jgi:hypothetical protein